MGRTVHGVYSQDRLSSSICNKTDFPVELPSASSSERAAACAVKEFMKHMKEHVKMTVLA